MKNFLQVALWSSALSVPVYYALKGLKIVHYDPPPQLPLLTAEGRKYARYIFKTHSFVSKIPFIGKYGLSFLVSICYSVILKEGAKEDGRRKTKVSRVSDGVSSDRGQGSRGVPEMRFSLEGIRAIQEMAYRSAEREQTKNAGEKTEQESV